MLTTTLNAIHECRPCIEGWKKLLKSLGKTRADDEPLLLVHVLESNGIEDAIWCLRAIKKHDKEIRLFAADCAESVLHLYEEKYPDDRPRKAIEAARKFANGEISGEELIEASSAAARVAYWAAVDAATAARAAHAAARAAHAAARAAHAAARVAYWAANWAANASASWAAYIAERAARAARATRIQERDKQAELFRKHFGKLL